MLHKHISPNQIIIGTEAPITTTTKHPAIIGSLIFHFVHVRQISCIQGTLFPDSSAALSHEFRDFSSGQGLKIGSRAGQADNSGTAGSLSSWSMTTWADEQAPYLILCACCIYRAEDLHWAALLCCEGVICGEESVGQLSLTNPGKNLMGQVQALSRE